MKKFTESSKQYVDLGRRKGLALLGGLSAMAIIPVTACAEQNNVTQALTPSDIDYDLTDPMDQLHIFEKLRGDLSGKMTFGFSEGRVFGIRPDLTDDLNGFGKEVFRYTGCGIYIKRVLENGNVETKSKGWLLYQDPLTGEFIDEITNPYTEEVVEVPPFRAGIRGGVQTPNGPVIDANFKMESTAFGQPLNLVFSEMGGRMHITRHAFTKWLESKTQTYRTEMTLDTYDFAKESLADRSLTHIPSDSHWTSQTAWLSLLRMAGTPGHMIWTSNGRTLFDKSDLPKDFVAATERKQPDIFGEPLQWDD